MTSREPRGAHPGLVARRALASPRSIRSTRRPASHPGEEPERLGPFIARTLPAGEARPERHRAPGIDSCARPLPVASGPARRQTPTRSIPPGRGRRRVARPAQRTRAAGDAGDRVASPPGPARDGYRLSGAGPSRTSDERSSCTVTSSEPHWLACRRPTRSGESSEESRAASSPASHRWHFGLRPTASSTESVLDLVDDAAPATAGRRGDDRHHAGHQWVRTTSRTAFWSMNQPRRNINVLLESS